MCQVRVPSELVSSRVNLIVFVTDSRSRRLMQRLFCLEGE